MNSRAREEQIIREAPRPDWFVGQPVGCTVGHCAEVQRLWGICMCELVHRLQHEATIARAKEIAREAALARETLRR